MASEKPTLEDTATADVSASETSGYAAVSRTHQVAVVAAGFIITSMTCSLIFAFGVYQALYEDLAKKPDTPFTGSSTALISLIGILAIALMSLGGPFAVNWSKQYSPQLVITLGALVFGAAFVLASFSKKLWQFALTQGLLAGIGVCMTYVPTSTVAPTWFTERRGLAMGIILSGTGVGGMVWPPVLRTLITHVGFPNTLRISGCIATFLVVMAGRALRWEPRFREKNYSKGQNVNAGISRAFKLSFPDRHTLKSGKFLGQALGCVFQSAGYSTPLFLYAAFAQARGYDTNAAANFITFSNASNFVSRVIIGYAADKLGRLNALFATTLLSSIAVLGFWLPSVFCDSKDCDKKADVLFILFTVLYGAFGSAYISLYPASLIENFGPKHFASVNGMLSLIRGTTALLGTPLTGLLISRSTALTSPRAYEHATIVVGVLLFVASLAIMWARIEATNGGSWRWKA